MKNPLDIKLTDDPEIAEYLRFTHSRVGLRHAQAKDGEGRPQDLLPDEKVPALSDSQLKELDVVLELLEKLRKDHLNHKNINQWICEKMWLIAGEYCGGTKFIAEFLKSLGISAEHETLFAMDGRLAGLTMVACRNSIDVSGATAVWLPCFPGARVIWLVRHPVDTLNSQYHFKKRTDGCTIDLQRDMMCRYTMMWNHQPPFIWRLESNSDQLMALETMGLPSKDLKPGALETARGAKRNSKKRTSKEVPVTWDNLIEPLKVWADDLGYCEEGLKKEHR